MTDNTNYFVCNKVGFLGYKILKIENHIVLYSIFCCYYTRDWALYKENRFILALESRSKNARCWNLPGFWNLMAEQGSSCYMVEQWVAGQQMPVKTGGDGVAGGREQTLRNNPPLRELTHFQRNKVMRKPSMPLKAPIFNITLARKF